MVPAKALKNHYKLDRSIPMQGLQIEKPKNTSQRIGIVSCAIYNTQLEVKLR